MLWIRKIVQRGGEEKGRSLLETQMSSFYVDDIDFSAANSSLHSHNELIFLCEEATQHLSKDMLGMGSDKARPKILARGHVFCIAQSILKLKSFLFSQKIG